MTQKIFKSIVLRYERGQHVDNFTMMKAMSGKVDQELILTVCDSTYAMPWAVKEHAKLIRDASLRRRMKEAAYAILSSADSAEEISDAVIANAEKLILDIGSAATLNTGPRPIQDIMEDHQAILEHRFANRGKLTGVDTGFSDLNRLTGGWQTKHVSIIAARPSVGKTAFALQCAMAAARSGDCALVFSIEMSEETVADRLLSSDGQVPLYNIRTGMILDEDWTNVSLGLSNFADPNLHLEIDESSNVTTAYIRSRVRRMMRNIPEGKRLAVFIDYLQMIRDSETKRERSKYEVVSEISRDLKAMAKEFGCAVIALAQLNRANEQRNDKTPLMSDIRDSGQIEQDADLIAFLHRDDYYDNEPTDNKAIEVLIKKNRNGPLGTVRLAFIKETQQFSDMPKPVQSQGA